LAVGIAASVAADPLVLAAVNRVTNHRSTDALALKATGLEREDLVGAHSGEVGDDHERGGDQRVLQCLEVFVVDAGAPWLAIDGGFDGAIDESRCVKVKAKLVAAIVDCPAQVLCIDLAVNRGEVLKIDDPPAQPRLGGKNCCAAGDPLLYECGGCGLATATGVRGHLVQK
jgi:hypothetical protein